MIEGWKDNIDYRDAIRFRNTFKIFYVSLTRTKHEFFVHNNPYDYKGCTWYQSY